MNAATLHDAWIAFAKPRIQARARSNRISSLGYRCVRRLVWDRLIGDLRPALPPEKAGIFAEGDLHEQAARRQMSSMGIDLIHVQREVVGPHNITGHIDGVIRDEDGEIVAEIKSVHPALWEKHRTLDDMLASSSPWIAAYPTQLCLYEYGVGTDRGVFVLRNKGTGQLRFVDCPRDENLVRASIDRAAYVEGWIGKLLPVLAPDRDRLHAFSVLAPEDWPTATPDAACQYCDYRGWACDLAALGREGGVSMLEDAELLEAAETMRRTAEAAGEHDRAKARLAEAMKARGPGVHFAGPVCGKVVSYTTTKHDIPADIKAQFARKESALRVTMSMEE